SEWSNRIRQNSGHAFITTLARVRVNSLSHFWLLRVFKLAALRQREEIEPRGSKLFRVIDRVFNATAPSDHFIREKSHANDVIITDAITYLTINFQGQAHAILPRTA